MRFGIVTSIGIIGMHSGNWHRIVTRHLRLAILAVFVGTLGFGFYNHAVASADSGCGVICDTYFWAQSGQGKGQNGSDAISQDWVIDQTSGLLYVGTSLNGNDLTLQANNPSSACKNDKLTITINNYKQLNFTATLVDYTSGCGGYYPTPITINNYWQSPNKQGWGQWQTPASITLGDNSVYMQSNVDAASGTMTLNGANVCNGPNQLTVANYTTATSASLVLNTVDDRHPGACQTANIPVTLINTYTSVTTTASWNTATDPADAIITINSVGHDLGSVITKGDLYTVPSCFGKGCPPPQSGPDLTLHGAPGKCDVTNTMTVKDYLNATSATLTCGDKTAPVVLLNVFGGGSGSSGSSGGNAGVTCAIDGLISWVVCPMIDLLHGGITLMSNALSTFLYTPTDQIFTSQFQAGYNTFRDVSLGLIVVAGLIMVISEAAGLDIFAAYTVRKALPRIVIAIIGISLAWPLLQFVITFFNDIGAWIGQVIIGLFPAASNNPAAGAQSVVAAIVGVGATIAAFAIAAGFVLSLLGTLFLALFVGFVVLAIRQMVILLCILTAPLAIASSIIPGTERLWKFWRETLLTTLFMFPIIMAVLASGTAISNVAQAAAKAAPDAGTSLQWDMLSIFALAASLFAVTFAMRAAGGAMGLIQSVIRGSGAHKGAFGILSSYRSRKLGQRWDAAKTGKFWRAGGNGLQSRIANRANSLVQGAALTVVEPNRSRRHALRSTIGFDTALAAAEKDSNVRAILGNDDYLMALNNSGDGSMTGIRNALRAISPSYTEAEVGAISSAVRSVGYDNMRKLAAVRLPGTGTAFKAANEGGAAMLQTLNEAFTGPGGFDRLGFARGLAAARDAGNQARRYELGSAGSFTDNLKWAEALRTGTKSFDQVRNEMDEKTILTANPGMIANMRNSGLQRLLPTIKKQFEAARNVAITTGDEEQLDNMSALLANLYDEMSRSAKENAALLADGVMRQRFDFAVTDQNGVRRQKNMTIQEYVDDVARNHSRFQQWRREYANRSAFWSEEQARAAGAQNQPQGGSAAPGGTHP